jgi:phage-related holin
MKSFIYTISASVGAFLHFIGLDPLALWILALSFILDFLTGITKAWVVGEYKSKIGWVKTLSKVLGIGLIACVALVLKLLGYGYGTFITASFMILACHDLISATANIYTIRTGKKLEEFDAISILIKAINEKLIALVKKLMP